MVWAGTISNDILIYLPPYTEKPRRATKETATTNSLLTSSTVALSFIPRYIHMQTCPDARSEVAIKAGKDQLCSSTWNLVTVKENTEIQFTTIRMVIHLQYLNYIYDAVNSNVCRPKLVCWEAPSLQVDKHSSHHFLRRWVGSREGVVKWRIRQCVGGTWWYISAQKSTSKV